MSRKRRFCRWCGGRPEQGAWLKGGFCSEDCRYLYRTELRTCTATEDRRGIHGSAGMVEPRLGVGTLLSEGFAMMAGMDPYSDEWAEEEDVA